MKKIIIAFLAGIILLFNSCAEEDMEYSYSIKDALKISAWVLDENIEENSYWELDENTDKIIDKVERDDVIYVFESLKLNEIKMLHPLGWRSLKYNMDMSDFNIFFEFDGIIEVKPEDDRYILLSYNETNPSEYARSETPIIYGNVKVPWTVYVNLWRMKEYTLDAKGRLYSYHEGTKIGREYYLNVNAYNFENEESPVIRAQLKLVVLEDKALPSSDLASFVDEDYSRFMSIELVSYEYSDRYRIMDEIVDEDD